MNKSEIKLISFKKFFTKYFKFHSDIIVFNPDADYSYEFKDPRVSFLELNINNGNQRKDWLEYSYYPFLGSSLNLKINDENALFGFIGNN